MLKPLAFNVFLVLLYSSCVGCAKISNLAFPASFKFGTATSAYQVEGGWNASGKGVSYWDYSTHNNPQIYANGDNGDVACDSYHKYQEDIQMLKDLKVNHYRFSISWSRILPTGFIYNVNQDGVDYYNNLIDGLLAAGIEPWTYVSNGSDEPGSYVIMVKYGICITDRRKSALPTKIQITIYHWDIPKTLDWLGGRAQPRTVDYFTSYADLLFSLYGDRVKTWITFNEPSSFCVTVINIAATFDTTKPTGVYEYVCSYYVLKTHASVYQLYQRKYKKAQRGRLSMTFLTQAYIPASNSSEDIEAAERMRQFDTGIYIHPLVHGNYPKVVMDVVNRYSAIQGFPESRLPKFTLLELICLKGAYDFLGINHYTTYIAKSNNTIVDQNPTIRNDQGATTYFDPSWPGPEFKVYPEGFRAALKWLKDTYKNPEIIILEQGIDDGNLNDTVRLNYYQLYLTEALKAIHEDKVRLTAYTAWSLMDVFEWNNGYNVKFGLYSVDFDSDNRTRTPKASASFYRKVIETRCLVDQCTG